MARDFAFGANVPDVWPEAEREKAMRSDVRFVKEMYDQPSLRACAAHIEALLARIRSLEQLVRDLREQK